MRTIAATAMLLTGVLFAADASTSAITRDGECYTILQVVTHLGGLGDRFRTGEVISAALLVTAALVLVVRGRRARIT